MISARLFDNIISPVFSEKATVANELNKFTFKVNNNADKVSIKESIEKIFNVKVKSVNILNLKGKSKIFKGRKGTRSGYKKAIVTLNAGQTIDLGVGA